MTETIRIGGNLVDVRRVAGELFESGQGFAVTTDQALGMLLGIDQQIRENLRDRLVAIEIQPIDKKDQWLVSLVPGKDRTQSLKQTYISAFEVVCAGVTSGDTRIDEILEKQGPLHQLWEMLSPVAQQELRGEGKSPQFVLRHDQAL